MSEEEIHPDGPEAQSFRIIQAKKPRVLLGVSGGVSAYKVVNLASKLTALGAGVKTVLTENACRFVGAKSFEAVTGHRFPFSFAGLLVASEQCIMVAHQVLRIPRRAPA